MYHSGASLLSFLKNNTVVEQTGHFIRADSWMCHSRYRWKWLKSIQLVQCQGPGVVHIGSLSHASQGPCLHVASVCVLGNPITQITCRGGLGHATIYLL